ncbi:MAG TPA: DNA topoisomerase IB [Telluria sp.]|nr:DNA topoisomerase IB [Telluria sp.]
MNTDDLDGPGAARAAGLRYVSDRTPGIARLADGAGFRYVDADGHGVSDPDTLERIRRLAIPPAWTDVWICALPHGHLQATGRDARGRKQYRYHARWRVVRDEAKYERMAAFGRALPRIRQAVAGDLALPGLPREKVLASIVTLLEATLMRVGNEEYARANHSFGLTTLRNRHVQVNGSAVAFRFRGKSGVVHARTISDRRLARLIRHIRELPGQELFQYLDEEGQVHAVNSADVNDYLRTIAGDDFTAKDFRTWAGTVLAALALGACGPASSATESKRLVAHAIEQVAAQLGNTAAVCRKCYVHPAVIDAYLGGVLREGWQAPEAPGPGAAPHGLQPEEAAVLALLERRLEAAAPAAKTSRTRKASPERQPRARA